MSKAREIAELGDVLTVSGSNVGIGTSSPASQLSVGGNPPAAGAIAAVGASGGVALALSDNVNSSLYVRNASGGSILGTDGGGNLRFATNGNTASSEAMRLVSAGHLLVGTTDVAQYNKTSGYGISLLQGGEIQAAGSNNCFAANRTNAVDGDVLKFFKQGVGVGSISVTGASTAYNTSSDYRLKTDAQPMTGASARVQALNPVNFEWIADGTRVDGFLAHEAQEVVPEAVHGTKDAMRDEEYEVTPAILDHDGNVFTEAVMGTRSVPDYQGIDQSKLVPLLTAALQEALTKIDDMETRLAALEGN
jgi:hypothetical protein